MTKWIYLLGGLLGVQLVLAVVFNSTDREYGAFQAEQRLLVFDKRAVDGLRLEDGQERLVLARRDGQWLLPEYGDFPLGQSSVDGLLDKLASLEKGWPVATTGSALRRFKVSDDQFERKLTLLSKGTTVAELYVGTSPGFRKVHVRPVQDDKVYSVGLDSWELEASADAWIDKGVLAVAESDVQQIELAGVVVQRGEDGELRVAGLDEGEQTDVDEARALLGKLSGLRVQSLLGDEAKPEYQQDSPTLEFKVTRQDDEVLTFRFTKLQDGGDYVVKRSDVDHYFKVAGFTLDALREVSRDKLVRSALPQAPGDDTGESQHASVEDDSPDVAN